MDSVFNSPFASAHAMPDADYRRDKGVGCPIKPNEVHVQRCSCAGERKVRSGIAVDFCRRQDSDKDNYPGR